MDNVTRLGDKYSTVYLNILISVRVLDLLPKNKLRNCYAARFSLVFLNAEYKDFLVKFYQ